MKSESVTGLVSLLLVVAPLLVLPAFAEHPCQFLIAKGSGSGLLCVAERDCFGPQVLHVQTGSTVIWKNDDIYSHTVTDGTPYESKVGQNFDSHLLGPGGEFAFTFGNPGVFRYFCEIHPWMEGVIDVSGAAAR